jgi:ectoine hydroxylase
VEADSAVSRIPEAAVMRGREGNLRLAFGLHRMSRLIGDMAATRQWVKVARDYLGGEIYLFQSKLTVNAAKVGEGWPWHQDVWKWQRRDGLLGAGLLTVVLFLDQVGAESGGLSLVPRTHHDFLPWVGDRLELDQNAVSRALQVAPAVTPAGPGGSVILFDGRIVHGSQANRSDSIRRLLYFTYNLCTNAPAVARSPWWYSETGTTPLR